MEVIRKLTTFWEVPKKIMNKQLLQIINKLTLNIPIIHLHLIKILLIIVKVIECLQVMKQSIIQPHPLQVIKEQKFTMLMDLKGFIMVLYFQIHHNLKKQRLLNIELFND